jgi:RimJ/RimL family protein N-acetyltransferase
MKAETFQAQPMIEPRIIETRRFTLRPLRPSDAGLIALHTGDLRVAQMTGTIPHPLPPGATEAYIARTTAPDRGEDAWAIDSTKGGGPEVLGVVLLKHSEGGVSELGFWVAPQFWNTGVASEATQALLAANPCGTRVFCASVFQDNSPSARVLTRCGFQYLGDAEGYCVARGAMLPTWTYSLKSA